MHIPRLEDSSYKSVLWGLSSGTVQTAFVCWATALASAGGCWSLLDLQFFSSFFFYCSLFLGWKNSIGQTSFSLSSSAFYKLPLCPAKWLLTYYLICILWESYTCVQCILITYHPSSPKCSTSLPNFTLHLISRVQLLLPIWAQALRAIYQWPSPLPAAISCY